MAGACANCRDAASQRLRGAVARVWIGHAYAHSRSAVWMKRAALPLGRGMYGFMRICLGPNLRRAVSRGVQAVISRNIGLCRHKAGWDLLTYWSGDRRAPAAGCPAGGTPFIGVVAARTSG